MSNQASSFLYHIPNIIRTRIRLAACTIVCIEIDKCVGDSTDQKVSKAKKREIQTPI